MAVANVWRNTGTNVALLATRRHVSGLCPTTCLDRPAEFPKLNLETVSIHKLESAHVAEPTPVTGMGAAVFIVPSPHTRTSPAYEPTRLAADIEMYPEKLGGGAVETALQAARGEPLKKRIDVGETLVTKENAAQFLK